ncbi:MAG: hypothetical protein A2070_11755 [Bdellovibrionales bacterium GWC1_52_8]|nr:MAG: hypothetical protein A2Z97_13465 [Bdellovibrionales bacterium GWB1_52_6]OFZ03182.1 MAG: hypothetical protein A2X97_04135 [Bdellovibrionales bacterium GWA1_52_35]OFZ35197.1 MAG: hypothetical protein A2070_11755 [Bdellovibrionales bacterium GWC1_52_8]
MSTQQTVLLVGGSGRTGMRVLEQLLNRGIRVRVIVRSPQKLPISTAKHPNLSIVEANLLSLSDEDLLRHISGCDAVISCLGHNISFNSIFFPPRDLVQQATARLCRVIETIRPEKPIKFILMSSVSVNHPRDLDTRRGKFEKTFLWMLRAVLPPAKDNQQAANFLFDKIGTDNAFAQWTAVRPDTLLKGDVSEYILQENFVSSLFAPDNTNMANVAHFMCELVTNSEAWDRWKGKLPVITNA